MSYLQLNKGFILGVICVLLPIGAWAKSVESLPIVHNMDMFVGEVKVLEKNAIERVAIGNGGVIRAEILGNNKELLIIAESEGSSSLRLWNKDGSQTEYNFRVSKTDPEKRVRMDSMIRIKIKMVEFRKSALTRLGIDWAQEVTGPTFATVGDALSSNIFRPSSATFGGALPLKVEPFSSYFGIATTLTSRINLLATDGDATILSEPVLTCVNGGTAKFLSGGSYPIPVTGSNGQVQVDFKEYGIKLEISPRANKNNEIYTTIKTEVSEIDESISVLGVPGVLSNETETIVNVLSGQTIVISGLLKTKTSQDVIRVPGLGHIPLLGGLFRSTETRNELMELVVFLTPEVVSVNETFDQRSKRLLNIEKTGVTTVSEALEYSLMD